MSPGSSVMPRRLITGPGADGTKGPGTTSAILSPTTTTEPSKGSLPVAVNTLASLKVVVGGVICPPIMTRPG